MSGVTVIAHVLLGATLLLSQPAPVRVLFVGNSLTYANDLPASVCALARSAGREAICESVARPDYGLEEHWNDGEARRVIARGWDVVVLQQGPSALPESRRLLIAYARRFDAEIKKAGARTAFYMVWPSRARRGDFAGVSQSYRAAAKDVKAQLMPVGDAWRAAWAVDADLQLYGPDGFHPSPIGSYLAALVIYEQVFAAPPPLTPVPSAAQPFAEVLRRVARETVAAVKP
ncbi:MAG TPA: SGNH/GDSL hydrolase family protein [Vicinamibacterales bacterium]|nr:SGNH/GDSL hydrolase family protein [Vicinamibacterales bacterium]